MEKRFIRTTSDIFTQSDKNLYLNSIVFIEDKGQIWTNDNTYPYSMGDGTKFLSDDGTYKTISNSGGSSEGGNSNTGAVLYEVDVNNANFYDITLSESVENFTKLDICACTDARELTFTSVYNPNNNNFNIYSMTQESGELIIKTRQYRISGDYISPITNIGGMSSISSNGIIVNPGNYIGIYKIIGY